MGRNYTKKVPNLNPPRMSISLLSFEGVNKFKSIRRAISRGNASEEGFIFPTRPFNNRKDRPLEDKKREIYERLKHQIQ